MAVQLAAEWLGGDQRIHPMALGRTPTELFGVTCFPWGASILKLLKLEYQNKRDTATYRHIQHLVTVIWQVSLGWYTYIVKQ